MAGGSSSLTFRLFGEDVSASRTLDKVGAEAEGLSAKFGKVGAVAGAAFAAVGVAVGVAAAASVKMAMDFDQSMARIGTMANVPKSQLKGLSDGVLNLAGQVGFSPTSLANALYMTESSFQSMHIKGFNALDALKTAAQGAAIGGSDLLTTTQAMDALLASGLVNVQNYKGAMDAMVSTVGSGEMTMQDFVDSLNGVQSVAGAYGNTMADMSAALATFGDNNIRGTQAGTQFRMIIQSLAVPAKAGQEALTKMGIGAQGLAKDMQEGGLNKAILDLHDHLTKLGIVGPKVGEWITMAFGKRAGVGLTDIYTNLDRFESKYKDVAALMGDKNSLAERWATQQQQFSQVLKDLEAGAEAVGIRIGNFLIPKIMEFGKTVADTWHNLNQMAGGQNSILKEFMVGFDNKSMSNFDSGFGGALERIGSSIRTLIDSAGHLGQQLGTALLPALKDIGQFITQSLWPSLQNLWEALKGPLGDALAVVVGAFKVAAALLKDVVGPVLVAVTGFLKDSKGAVEALAVALAALWLEAKGASILETLALRAMYVRDAFSAMTAMVGTHGVGGSLKLLGGEALSTGTVMGGALAVGVGLAANAFVNFVTGSHAAETAISQINTSLAKTPQSTYAYATAIDTVQAKIASLKSQLGGAGGIFGWITGSSESNAAQLDKYRAELDKLNAMHDQVARNNAVLAQQLSHNYGPGFQGLTVDPALYQKNLAVINAMTAAGVQFNGTLDQSKAAVDAFAGAGATGVAAQMALANWFKVSGDNSASAASKVQAYSDAINALNGGTIDLMQSQDAATKAVNDIGSALAQGSSDFTGNSDAAIQNRGALAGVAQAVLQHVSAMNEQGKSTQQVSDYMNWMKASLVGQLTQLHMNTPAVMALVDSLFTIPAAKATQVSVPGAAGSTLQIDALNTALANIKGERTVTINAIDHASSTISAIQSMIANLNPNIPLTVTGYANLSKLTSPQFNANGSITAFAGGGFENHVAQFASGGTMRIWAEPETGGEAYIPLAASKRSRSLAIWQETGRRLGVDTASPVIVNLHGPVYSDSAGLRRLITEIDREVSRGGSVPSTFRR